MNNKTFHHLERLLSPVQQRTYWLRNLFSLPHNNGKLIAVPAYDPHHRYQRMQQQESWWVQLKAWIRYHTIQLQWDIERRWARLLRRL